MNAGREARGRACAIGNLTLELSAAPLFAPFVDALLDRYTDSMHVARPFQPSYRLCVELVVGTPSSSARESRFTDHDGVLTDACAGWDATVHFVNNGPVHAVFAMRDQSEFGPDGDIFMARWVAGAVRVALALAAPHFGSLLVHGAAIRIGGLACVLLGPSGAGKTTLAARFDAAGPLPRESADPIDRFAMSDDAALLFPARPDQWCALGTPVPGREGRPQSGDVTELHALMHLVPNHPFAITEMSRAESFSALLKRVLYFAAPTEAVLERVHHLAERQRSYMLSSMLDDDIVPRVTSIVRYGA